MESDPAGNVNRPRILITFPGALGDLICFTPAIRALSRRHPDVSIQLMAQERLARFALGRMGIDCAHSIDRREVSLLFVDSDGPAPEAREFFASFDRIYSFFASDDEAFRRSLGLIAGEKASFHPFCPDGFGHVAAGYLSSIGEPSESLGPCVKLASEDLDAARRKLEACGLKRGKFVALMPGSGSLKKNWPAEKYAELAERLKSRTPVAIVLGPAEASVTCFFDSSGVSVLNGLDLAELSGILASASVFVGNDSGVSHLAAAAGTPGVAIFGPTDPARWRPLGDVAIVQRSPISELGVEEVVSMAEARLR